MQYYPTGGWGQSWLGDPDRGFGRHQPSGWIYWVLPFIEQQQVHDLGKGVTDPTAKQQAATQMNETPIATLMCPSRRTAKAYPINPANCCASYYDGSGQQINTPLKAKTDYAAKLRRRAATLLHHECRDAFELHTGRRWFLV